MSNIYNGQDTLTFNVHTLGTQKDFWDMVYLHFKVIIFRKLELKYAACINGIHVLVFVISKVNIWFYCIFKLQNYTKGKKNLSW